jgi:hypothetical protein
MATEAGTGPIAVHSFDAAKLKRIVTRDGEFVNWIQPGINEENCAAAFQEFRADEPQGYFVFWYDELHYVVSGEAECTYRMPPTYNDEFSFRAKTGDFYLLPQGVHHRWQVIGDGPYRTLWVCMPRPRWFADLV